MRKPVHGGFLLLMFAICFADCVADEPNGVGRASIFAGTGRSPDKQTLPYQANQPSDGREVALGNPFGVEVVGSRVLVTTVDDQCVWECGLKGHKFRRVVGSGKQGRSGDNGDALHASFNWPHEVRVDQAGNLFIADTRNHQIRKVDARSNVASLVAGDGTAGFAGDGAKGTSVRFDQPHSVVLDGAGALLVADTKNHRVRKIDLSSGVVSTICGDGKKKLPVHGELAVTQSVFGPRSLAVDERSVWLVLREGNSLWRIDRSDGRIYHVAGTGKKGYDGDGGPPREATFRGPKGVAIDSQGRVLVVDTENHAVRRIDAKTNTITTVLGGSRAEQTLSLRRPHGIAPLPDGGFLVGDSENHRVVQWKD